MIRISERKKVIHCNLNAVYMAAAYNPGAAIVFHSPKACSHIARNSYWSIRNNMVLEGRKSLQNVQDNLFVTGLSDKEAIFGGEKLLLNCLLDISATKKPEYIIVVSGCAAGVIGDDVVSVCKEAENKTHIPTLSLPGAGFMNKQSVDGLLLITELLTERFLFIDREHNFFNERNDKTATFLGTYYNMMQEMELSEFLHVFHYFGFEKILYPPCGMTKKEIQELAQTSFIATTGLRQGNFITNLNFAQKFAKKLNVPYLSLNLPNTCQEVMKYLFEIGERLNKPYIAESAIYAEKQRYNKIINIAKRDISGKIFVIAIGMPSSYFNPMATIEVLLDCDATVKAIVLLEELTVREKSCYREYFAKKWPEHPTILNEDALASIQNEVDCVLTTHAKEIISKQYCLKMKRVFIGGIERFLQGFTRFVTEQRRIYYER
jgi:nitrogenase molybdenum-iron protein alpha chain